MGFGVGVGEGGGVAVSASVRLLDENAFRWTYRESAFRRVLDDFVARQVLRVATAAIRAFKKRPSKNNSASTFFVFPTSYKKKHSLLARCIF